MRLYLDHIGIVELFAEAHERGLAIRPWVDPGEGFIVPQKGKSGLSAPRNRTPEEKRAVRSAVVVETRRRRIAKDPGFRAVEQAKSTARVKAWREKNRVIAKERNEDRIGK